MVSLPRLVIAAPSTGQGKTTVATGLMAALRAAGHEVSGHKVGPDYIDPGYHALATGRPGRNLDPHLVGEERIVPLLLHGAAGADVAIIEGVMGLYDGRLDSEGFSSTAHVAALTSSPVVLVLDVARLSRTAGAIVAGMAAYDDSVQIAGVVLNCAGSDRNLAEIRRSLERTGIPVLGALPHDDRLAAPSRHLGLVPVDERAASIATIEHLGEQVSRHLELDALLAIANGARDLTASPWDPATEINATSADRPVVAMAGGRAFTFRYAETEELLRAAGCDVVTFDPLTDAALPSGTRGIYLGGGFPEVYAGDLAANRSLLADLRAAVESNVPTIAECAGLLYLAQSLDGDAMAGVVPAVAEMSERLTLRYPVATGLADTLLTRVGEQVTGHEFHRTATAPAAGPTPAWEIDAAPTGFASDTWHASYLHTHWAGHPQLAQRFADAAHACAPHSSSSSSSASSSSARSGRVPAAAPGRVVGHTTRTPAVGDEPESEVPAGRVSPDAPERVVRHTTRAPATADEAEPLEPLRHHGDTEVEQGMLDFAVNVYDGPRPAWLDQTLHAAIDDAASYPDVRPATEVIARRHGRPALDVLPTAGAAEAFTLIARLRDWRKPVVVHPQFTEPQAALEVAGHHVTEVICRTEDGFALDVDAIPDDADLVVIGNPTNPTGVLHSADTIKAIAKPGRVVVVDEAFMDAVPGEAETLANERLDGVLILRSLTKQWSIPGIRAGYVVGDRYLISDLARLQTPWSVSTLAIAAIVACLSDEAAEESRVRADDIAAWRGQLEASLRERNLEFVASDASFVLARLGDGTRNALRKQGIAVRRADTFPGLDATWVRIAVRPLTQTAKLFAALDQLDVTRAAALTGIQS